MKHTVTSREMLNLKEALEQERTAREQAERERDEARETLRVIKKERDTSVAYWSDMFTKAEQRGRGFEAADRRATEAESKLAAAASLIAETHAALDAAGAPVAIVDARSESVPLSLAQRVKRLGAEVGRLRAGLLAVPHTCAAHRHLPCGGCEATAIVQRGE